MRDGTAFCPDLQLSSKLTGYHGHLIIVSTCSAEKVPEPFIVSNEPLPDRKPGLLSVEVVGTSVLNATRPKMFVLLISNT